VKKKSWLHSPPTGDYFGNRGVELAGIIIDPALQNHQVGPDMVRIFIDQFTPDTMTAYTRNPGVLRILGNVSSRHDVLTNENPEEIAEQLAYASVHNGILYHIDRYGPSGLYGSYDPADRVYNKRVLKERAVLLQNPNNALAVSVDISGIRHE
jgi:hypothetical protein